MALAIDGSTPAIATQTSNTTATVTTASFTPPANSLLLVLWSWNTNGGDLPTAPSITDSLGVPLTYTAWDFASRSDSPACNGQAATWSAQVGTSAAMTITVTSHAGLQGGALRVIVLTGHDTVTPIGAHGKGASVSASSIAQNYTAQATNGWGFIATSDWDVVGLQTAGTGCTLDGSGSPGSQITYGFLRRTTADDSNGATNTLNVNLPATSNNLHWVYIEVLPAAGPAAFNDPVAVPTPLPLQLPAMPFAPGPMPLWQPWAGAGFDAPTTQVTADTGTATLGLAATGAVKKVAAVTATAALGLAATGTARKVAPQAGRAALGVVSTATARKAAPAVASSPVGLASTSTTRKVAVTADRGVLGLAARSAAVHIAAPTGRSVAGLAARAGGAKLAPSTGRAALGVEAFQTGSVPRQVTGAPALGLTATVTAKRVAKPTQTAALALAGQPVTARRALPTAASRLGLFAGYSAKDIRAVAARAVLALRAQQHQCITYRSNIGTTAQPSTGTTAYASATTARPDNGITARPNTGTTSPPC